MMRRQLCNRYSIQWTAPAVYHLPFPEQALTRGQVQARHATDRHHSWGQISATGVWSLDQCSNDSHPRPPQARCMEQRHQSADGWTTLSHEAPFNSIIPHDSRDLAAKMAFE